MATPVEGTLAEQRNKTVLQAWFKTVARDLETFQVVIREWICENVWRLPDLPKPKEQYYGPAKGRRDIRVFPETEMTEAPNNCMF